MIIFGFGKMTKKFLGGVFEKTCPNCSTTDTWQLCILRTWVTLFFIPIIPYKLTYCVACPKCGGFVKLTKEQFDKIRFNLLNVDTDPSDNSAGDILASLAETDKYHGKTETQINFLKELEAFKKNR